MVDVRELGCPFEEGSQDISLEIDVDFWLANESLDSKRCIHCTQSLQENSSQSLSSDTNASLPPNIPISPPSLQAPESLPTLFNSHFARKIWNLTNVYLSDLQQVAALEKCVKPRGLRKRRRSVAKNRELKTKRIAEFADKYLSDKFFPPTQEFISKLHWELVRKNKGKTGRKPGCCPCLLCQKSFAYSKGLIEHLRAEHGIEKSVSLMYKRIKQGRDTIERLYL